ncbi:hypothetical protein F5Y15DRAFT_228442 [Xylariaceae sp. FL0016]|nr:hypothetical protein F5Y15DRAFT_228442 [Xylariaceae sp. FL0016]
MPTQSYSSSYTSFTSSTSANGGAPQQHTYAERSYTDASGTTTERYTQRPGEAPVHETFQQPSGRSLQSGTAPTQNRIEDVTDKEAADKAYEERIEDEYAKREGGA